MNILHLLHLLYIPHHNKDILNKYNTSYEISYGYNYFPKKSYKGIAYPSGNYKSLVIILYHILEI